MTKGLAILCMLILHLFCRKGDDVLGTPLIWVNKTTPLVYYFGFFAEICVPIYSLCVGYAQQYMYESGKLSWKGNVRRIGKLIINYWIILFIFCFLGVLFDQDHIIPGSLPAFLKSIVLLHSYNGAWWYLNTYILLLLVSFLIIIWPIRKMKNILGVVLCLLFQIGWYGIQRLDVLSVSYMDGVVLSFIYKEIFNLLNVLPYVWMGALICKSRFMEKSMRWLDMHMPKQRRNVLLIDMEVLLFLLTNILHKAAVFGVVSVISFWIFNMLWKSERIKKFFLFLGRHSTNIWLTHMFFYLYLFKDLVTAVRYPVLMLAFMIILCIVVSYVVFAITGYIERAKEGMRI